MAPFWRPAMGSDEPVRLCRLGTGVLADVTDAVIQGGRTSLDTQPAHRRRRRAIPYPRGVTGDVDTTVRGRLGTACLAPQSTLYFMTNGDVRSCCLNDTYPLGNVARERLPQIWEGTRRAKLIDHLAVSDFALGCHACDWQEANEGDDASYARRFDEFAPDLAAQRDDDAWPVHLEFNLSNSCNLQCIQCYGGLSSSIRIHREKLPPLPRVYDDQFFDDLVPFLAHARDIQVAGGEPFLGAETLRLWDLIERHGTAATRSVVTNGTQWNARVERILEAVPMSIIVSIDGISREVYESIRVGADHAEVLRNIDRFVAYTAEHGTNVSFNHCLMPQNYHELGDLLLFAEARNILVNVSVVYRPVECSLAGLDADALARVCDELEAQSDRVLPHLRRNAGVWQTELARLRQWHRFRVAGADHEALVTVSSRPDYIVGMNVRGTAAHDDRAARRVLNDAYPEAEVSTVTVGAGDRITDCEDGCAEALGLGGATLVGLTAQEMLARLVERHGEVGDVEILESDDDHVDQVMAYGTTRFRSITVAMRDDDGVAEQVRLLFTRLEG